MAAVNDPRYRADERCVACDRHTAHRVEIRLVVTDTETPSGKFSRHPLRVATCQTCGTERRRAREM